MDQTQGANFKQVIEALEKEGVDQEQIAQIVEDLAKTASTKFYAEATALFSEEDLDEIDAAQTEDETNQIISRKFQERTGRDPEIAMQQFLNTFAQGFLEEYRKSKANSTT